MQGSVNSCTPWYASILHVRKLLIQFFHWLSETNHLGLLFVTEFSASQMFLFCFIYSCCFTSYSTYIASKIIIYTHDLLSLQSYWFSMLFYYAQPYWISHSVISHHVQVGSQAYLLQDLLPVVFLDLFSCTHPLPLTPKQQHWLGRTLIHRITSPNCLLWLFFSGIH